MIFEMNLHNEPFELIKSKSKTIEMRINDERRMFDLQSAPCVSQN